MLDRDVCIGERCLYWREMYVLERDVCIGERCLYWREMSVLARCLYSRDVFESIYIRGVYAELPTGL